MKSDCRIIVGCQVSEEEETFIWYSEVEDRTLMFVSMEQVQHMFVKMTSSYCVKAWDEVLSPVFRSEEQLCKLGPVHQLKFSLALNNCSRGYFDVNLFFIWIMIRVLEELSRTLSIELGIIIRDDRYGLILYDILGLCHDRIDFCGIQLCSLLRLDKLFIKCCFLEIGLVWFRQHLILGFFGQLQLSLLGLE